MRLLIGLACTAMVAGCATPPATIPFENTATLPLSKDAVWSNLVEYFATSNIAIKTIEKDSGIIYAERMLAGPSEIATVASCGSAFLAPAVAATADLNVFVRENGDGTKVTVTTQFRETRSNALAQGQLSVARCNSLGVIEGAVLAAASGR